MTIPKIQQKQLLIPAQQVMNGFCYAFSEALLQKIKDLQRERKFFLNYDHVDKILTKKGEGDVNYSFRLTEIAGSVANELNSQVGLKIPGNPKKLNEFIKDIEEFLAIFKVRE